MQDVGVRTEDKWSEIDKRVRWLQQTSMVWLPCFSKKTYLSLMGKVSKRLKLVGAFLDSYNDTSAQLHHAPKASLQRVRGDTLGLKCPARHDLQHEVKPFSKNSQNATIFIYYITIWFKNILYAFKFLLLSKTDQTEMFHNSQKKMWSGYIKQTKISPNNFQRANKNKISSKRCFVLYWGVWIYLFACKLPHIH